MSDVYEAANHLFDLLSDYEGFSSSKVHEDDILVRYFPETEVEAKIPARFEGHTVRKSPYQKACPA